MSSKLREDLPTKANDRFSDSFIKMCNNYRADYKKIVKITKELYTDRAVIVNNLESYNNKNNTLNGGNAMKVFGGGMCNLLLGGLIDNNTASSQVLLKKELKQEEPFILIRSYDFITAFYVPKDLKWLKFWGGGIVLGQYWGRIRDDIDLEEILDQSKKVPDWQDKEFLEYILWLSKQGKVGMIHRQEEEIEIDGVTHVRLIFIQPLIPNVAITYHELKVEISEDRAIYIEMNYAANEYRTTIRNQKYIPIWIENESDNSPLCLVSDGFITDLISDNNTPNKDIELLNALECDPFIIKNNKDLMIDNTIEQPSIINDDNDMKLHFETKW